MASGTGEKNNNNKASLPQTIYNYAMGILWTGLGVFVLFHKQLGYELGRLQNDPVLSSIFGGAAILYGIFRLYRGYLKQR